MAPMSRLHLMRLISPQIFFSFQLRNIQHSSLLLLSMLFGTVYHHYTTYDMNVRPTILFRDPPMENPVEDLPAATFFFSAAPLVVQQLRAHHPSSLQFFCC